MIKLKELLLEVVSGITEKDIYNFYFLFSVASYHPETVKSDYGKFIQDTYIKALKNKYVGLFKRLVTEQLIKYIKLKRIDPDFDVSKVKETSSASTLLELMKKTFRTDMKRRNDTWIQTCEFLAKLEDAVTVKEMYLYIDRLNSMVHNTQTSILGKVSDRLVKAYDYVHNSKSIKDYQQYVDSDIRRLMNQTQ